MKKLTQCLLSTLMAGGAICGGLAGSVATKAISIRDVWAYRAEPFSISAIYPNRNEISVHYYGVGDDTKTNHLNVYWSDFSSVSEDEVDALMGGVTTSVPGYAQLFTNKKTELSPNTVSTWRTWRYENMGSVELKEVPGVLYYSVRLANGSYLTGKADYRDCLNNPLYIEAGDGAYCKLEQYEEGGDLYYWPYEWSTGRLGSDDEPMKPVEGADEGEDDGAGDDSGLGGNDDAGGEDVEKADGEDSGAEEPVDEEPVDEEPIDDGEPDHEDNDGTNEPTSDEPKEQQEIVVPAVPKTPNTGFEPRA